MGFPVGTTKIAAVKVAANADYPNTTNNCINFDLSKCSAAWWGAVTALSDIVVYDAVSDTLRPRYICPTSSIAGKTGWGVCDSAISPLGKTLYLCIVPGAGAVNAATAHTNSNCFSAHGYDVASGNIPDKTGAYTGTVSNCTYSQAGVICKSLLLNAANSRVDLGVITQVSGATQFSWVLLFSKNVIGSGGSFLWRASASSTDYLNIYFSGTDFGVTIRIGGVSSYGVVSNYPSFLTANVFSLLTIQYDGTQVNGNTALQNAARLKVQFDNSAKSITFSGAAIPAALPIVTDSSYAGYPTTNFEGKYDEDRYYSRPISLSEVALMYKNLKDHSNFATYSDYSLLRTPYSFNMGMAYVY
jgi:hypothetical protein